MSDDKALMTVRIQGKSPGIESAAAALGVEKDAVDPGFGVVPIDPNDNLYAVQVRSSALPSADKPDADQAYEGPFSNPRIEGFGSTGE